MKLTREDIDRIISNSIQLELISPGDTGDQPDSDQIERLREVKSLALSALATQPRPIAEAPKDGGRMLSKIDGQWRVIAWGKTSHVPMYGWILVDQGAEDCDLCEPTHFIPLAALPEPQA